MGFDINKNNKPIAQINVTPFVDVMLVLLVIFMVSTPLLLSGIELKLPKTKKVHTLSKGQQRLVLSVKSNKELYLGEQKIAKDKLIARILSKFKSMQTKVLYIRADYQLSYGDVAKLMAQLKVGGISDISLVTQAHDK